MHEVKIIIDPSLDTIIPGTRSEFEQMLKSGDAGTFLSFCPVFLPSRRRVSRR